MSTSAHSETSVLANFYWRALVGPQARFALGAGTARRLAPGFAPLRPGPFGPRTPGQMERHEPPLLHVRVENADAYRLCERMGFRAPCRRTVRVVPYLGRAH